MAFATHVLRATSGLRADLMSLNCLTGFLPTKLRAWAPFEDLANSAR